MSLEGLPQPQVLVSATEQLKKAVWRACAHRLMLEGATSAQQSPINFKEDDEALAMTKSGSRKVRGPRKLQTYVQL